MDKSFQELQISIRDSLLLIGDIIGKSTIIQLNRQQRSSIQKDTSAGDIFQLCTLLEEIKSSLRKADNALLNIESLFDDSCK